MMGLGSRRLTYNTSIYYNIFVIFVISSLYPESYLFFTSHNPSSSAVNPDLPQTRSTPSDLYQSFIYILHNIYRTRFGSYIDLIETYLW